MQTGRLCCHRRPGEGHGWIRAGINYTPKYSKVTHHFVRGLNFVKTNSDVFKTFMVGTEFINIQGEPGMLDRACSVYCTEGKVDFSPDKTQLLLPSAALQVWLL